jgi:hypothetical protein
MRLLFSFSFILLFILISGIQNYAFSRPVSYLGGNSTMWHSRASQIELMHSYTLYPNFSAGAHLHSLQTISFVHAIANFLPLRWNAEGQQTNLYIGVGLGLGVTNTSTRKASLDLLFKNTLPTTQLQLDFDSETRKLYFAFQALSIQKISNNKLSNQEHNWFNREGFYNAKLRLGAAPYLASAGGLHSFVIAQLHFQNKTNEFNVTPLIRMFHQNLLVEFGSSFRGQLELNWKTEI